MAPLGREQMAGPGLSRTVSNTSSGQHQHQQQQQQKLHATTAGRPPRTGSLSSQPGDDRPVLGGGGAADPPAPAASSGPEPTSSSSSSPPHPSLLQPRVAVVLNVPTLWHPWLFALRLCSILPAVWWGLPSALQLLLRLLPRQPDLVLAVSACAPGLAACELDPAAAAARYALTETALATIWCFASGYLSFFFTDCLMSRWLINYTPQATIVRLLTINAVNAYVTSTVLSLSGGFDDPRLLLPGWIGIATTLTGCYHITHQKINIRKETVTSINVFSFASYISMVTLLFHLHSSQPTYPTMPVVSKGRYVWQEVSGAVARLRQLVENSQHREL